MTTITLKIDERTKKGKAFLALAKVFYEEKNEKKNEVELVDEKDKSPYNPEFVAMIEARIENHKSGKSKSITVNPNDIWGSLGLK